MLKKTSAPTRASKHHPSQRMSPAAPTWPAHDASLSSLLKSVLPNTAAARDALHLVALVQVSELALPAYEPLRLHLDLAGWEPSGHRAESSDWRAAAARVTELCEFSAGGQMLELGLHEIALLIDPSLTWQMFSVTQHLMFAGIPLVHPDDVLPIIDFGRATANAFDVAHAREIIRDRVRSICMDAAHAAGAMRRFPQWSVNDLAAALLAIRMTYCALHQRMDGRPATPKELSADFQEIGMPTWRSVLVHLDSISAPHPEWVLQSPIWRAFTPEAIQSYLRAREQGDAGGARAAIAQACAAKGFR